MWQQMTLRKEQFYVKSSFLEIYNEQLRDLLNPESGVLHARWNAKNGFFVEDLMVVECTSIDDLIAVLHEGIKNRHTGSHELNKDSSRSHSILTVYLISEHKNEQEDHIYKKYGKISFVDLAGSEKLKESQSEGLMMKETGSINKSLFTLGKVISLLASKDKAPKEKYIPFRDSKLTMLLQDSMGGTSKALMIACVSPSEMYTEETISTLNYATRTMNIKNKPIIQMDAKEQIIFNLRREI
jgi:kinesin family protein 12